jgi:hypothetical protein
MISYHVFKEGFTGIKIVFADKRCTRTSGRHVLRINKRSNTNEIYRNNIGMCE